MLPDKDFDSQLGGLGQGRSVTVRSIVGRDSCFSSSSENQRSVIADCSSRRLRRAILWQPAGGWHRGVALVSGSGPPSRGREWPT